MKHYLTYLSCAATTMFYAQSEPMFGEMQINSNPAAAGLFYNQSAFLTSQAQFEKSSPSDYNTFLNGVIGYQQKVEKLHGGLGFTIGGAFGDFRGFGDYGYNGGGLSPKLHYSYQFNFDDGSTIAGGAAVGYSQSGYDILSSAGSDRYSFQHLYTTLGVMYKRPSWYVGLSSTPLTMYQKLVNPSGSDSNPYATVGLITTAGYLFEIGEKWTLQPQFVGAFAMGGNYADQSEISLTTTYADRFWLKVGFTNPEVGFMAGMNINERLRLGYGMSNLTNVIKWSDSPIHQLNFSYLIR